MDFSSFLSVFGKMFSEWQLKNMSSEQLVTAWFRVGAADHRFSDWQGEGRQIVQHILRLAYDNEIQRRLNSGFLDAGELDDIKKGLSPEITLGVEHK
jgi:hypothetical protein